MDVKESVRSQFGRVAANYAASAVHLDGPDLRAMREAWPLTGQELVLDAGTGAGHATLALAPLVGRVVTVDLAEPMLAQARRLAEERGIANVEFRQGDVEHLPFPDAAFDLVVSRFVAHHFPHPQRAIGELARVLKPVGAFLLVDVVSPDDPATDTYLNAVELLRDTSHVRDHSIEQWRVMFERADLSFEELGTWPLRLEFESWVTRMETPAPAVAQIRALFDAAPAEVRAALRIEADNTFSSPMALMRGRHR
jgi:ubiquinone/menaquinone biosynthesis C-methylase UbiE